MEKQKNNPWILGRNGFCGAFRASQHKPGTPSVDDLAGEGVHGRGEKQVTHRRGVIAKGRRDIPCNFTVSPSE
jgi:hypothetical protein